ncbi:hypothetical protein [Nostoc sp. NMS4]|uniref:hypothetical protein n=1 Tax=Nostoc sp. NMS4 TaxID=2815390 RepID=UPI0025EC6445|nr:hypothetical protein [Nostoc sp. NMS4]MBN3922229.1 hypothetical protein [Nostoc sp. NMS4]
MIKFVLVIPGFPTSKIVAIVSAVYSPGSAVIMRSLALYLIETSVWCSKILFCLTR